LNRAFNTCGFGTSRASLSKSGVIDEISGTRSFIALMFLAVSASSNEISSGILVRISTPLSVFF
jgi:hypothetical protein